MPYMQKNMGNSWKPGFHELEYESKMRLFKTHSHTSERRGCQADNKRQENRERKGAYASETAKNVKENDRHIT